MKIWASHPKPKEGEILSSWIIRIAAGCGMTATEFCKTTLNIPKPNLREIDRYPDELLLKALSDGTGVPIETIFQTSMATEEGYVFSLTGDGETYWTITPLTSHSKITEFTQGMAYCPACFGSDEVPYYRKDWQYAFNPICSIHHTPLRSSCPHCNLPFTFLQPVANKRIKSMPLQVSTCWSCGGNVGTFKQESHQNDDVFDHALSIQKFILNGIANGGFEVPGYGFVHTRAYLDVMHCVIDSLAIARYSTDRSNHVSRKSGLNFEKFGISNNWYDRTDFEHLRAESRAKSLCLANWLMGEWPRRLVEYAKHFNLTYSKLFKSIDVPHWLLTTARPQLLPEQNDACSDEEKEFATKLLRSKMKRPVTPSEAKEFMEIGSLGDHSAKRMAHKEKSDAMHKIFSLKWEFEKESAKRRRQAKAIERKKYKPEKKKITDIQQPSDETSNQQNDKPDPTK